MEKSFVLVVILTVAVACQSQSGTSEHSPATEEGGEERATEDDIVEEEAVDDDDEDMVVDDDEDNDEVERVGNRGESDDDCPPRREERGGCIAVIAYGLTAEGKCCQYPTPCDVPDEIVEEFRNLDSCEEAAEELGGEAR